MKVLYVIDSLGAGGAERSLAEMHPLLEEAGIQTVILCFHHSEEGFETEAVRGGADVRFIGARGAWSRSRAIRKVIAEEAPDIVHTTLYEADVAGRLAAIGHKATVVTSLVNTPYTPLRRLDPNIRPWRLRVVQAIDASTARHLTNHFHAITGAVKEWAVTALRLDPDRITVIERGRDPIRLGAPSSERRDRSRKALGLDPDDRVLLSVGRQEYQKGQRYLLEAMRLLSTDHAPVKLLVAGREGHATSELRGLASGLPSVRFLGHRDDLPEILAAADVFVFPSLYEGLGGSLIEAMALGLPIVASELPAVREVLREGENALLVEPASPSAIASSIDRLAGDPALSERFGKRSREIFLERFTLERSAARMIELYERLGPDVRLPSASAN